MTYKYGPVGYIMRYLGPPFFILLGLVFVAICLVTPFSGAYAEKPIYSAIGHLTCVFMIPVCYRYTLMLFKNGRQLLFAYELTNEGISISGKEKSLVIPKNKILRVDYLRILKVIEIYTAEPGWSKILFIPNNTKIHSQGFEAIKEWSKKMSRFNVKWW